MTKIYCDNEYCTYNSNNGVCQRENITLEYMECIDFKTRSLDLGKIKNISKEE